MEMTMSDKATAPVRGAQHEALGVFLGRWRAEGRSYGGIAILPSYIPQVDPRLVVLNFRPLASVRFWLAYSERARSLLRCSPVLTWLRDCFDPERHPAFREAYVTPAAVVTS